MRAPIFAIVLFLIAATTASAQVANSPDGKLVAVGNGKQIMVLDAGTQKELLRLSGHTLLVTALTFSPDGRLLVSGSLDKNVRVWEVATGREVRRIVIDAPVQSVVVSENSKLVTVVDQNKKARSFELASGAEVKKDK